MNTDNNPMKKTLLAPLALAAAIMLNATPGFAHSDHEHDTPPPAPKVEKPKKPADSHGHSHATKIPDTVEDIWKAIHKQQAHLVSLVDEKKLSSAHDPAFAIRDLVKALPGKVPAASKTVAEEGGKEIAKFAADIDKSSAAGAQKATEENVKKLGTSLKALEAKLKPAEAKP
jgi:hypothetical protein